MISFNFWHKWLLTASFFVIIFGLTIILFNQSLLFDVLFNHDVNAVFWTEKALTPEILLFQKWLYATLGAIIAGWGVFMTFISAYPFRNKERWSWNCFALGLLFWFAADTSVSLTFHVYANVFTNVILLVILGLPIFFTRKYF